jgi:hypothetical protein
MQITSQGNSHKRDMSDDIFKTDSEIKKESPIAAYSL